jgi:predicted AlkP superfamily pyrophosphatase or phosphodiesterase
MKRLLLLLVLLATGCRMGSDVEKTVILISIDGFRADYTDLYETPNLDRLIAGGAHAQEGMKPVYPSKTFPNHYSIVTGLYPARHGIVSNSMYDPDLDDTFSISDREAVENPEWWEGEPIWTAVEKQGGRAATYFWVGSETPFDDIRPSYWYTYDGSVPGEERVDQVLEWLDLPDEERPRFISLYFSEVDDAGHWNGPESPETAASVANVDGYIGRLITGLEDRGIFDRVNVIVVSDHGMSQLSPDRVVALDDYVSMDDLLWQDSTPLIGLWPAEGKTQAVFDALNGAHPSLQVWMRDDVPERFHYVGNKRIPPIVGHLDDGWSLARTREWAEANPNRFTGGTHGYDNEVISMRALFVAHGPAFKEGVTVEPFVNVELYNVMAGILDIQPSNNDGTPGTLDAILR